MAIPKLHAEGSNSSAPAIGIFRRQDVFAYNRTSLQNGPVVQLVRTLACHARGRRFEPVHGRQYASVAQLVEQGTENPRVAGSIPALGTICGLSSSGRAPPCQGGGSEFEPRSPLQSKSGHPIWMP